MKRRGKIPKTVRPVRILDRYIIVEFLKVFMLCVGGIILVILLVEITD